MPESSDHTHDLILRLTQDYLKSMRTWRITTYVQIAVAAAIIITGLLLPPAGSIITTIAPAAGVSLGSASYFPIKNTIDLNQKIRTLEHLRDELERSDANSADREDEIKKIEDIIWKLVEHTVVS